MTISEQEAKRIKAVDSKNIHARTNRIEMEKERKDICLNIMKGLLPEAEDIMSEESPVFLKSYFKKHPDPSKFSYVDEYNSDYIMRTKGWPSAKYFIDKDENIAGKKHMAALGVLEAFAAFNVTNNFYYYACFMQAYQEMREYKFALDPQDDENVE